MLDPPSLGAVPDQLRPLIAGCLSKDPDARPSTEALLSLLAPADLAALTPPALVEALRKRATATATLAAGLPPPPEPPKRRLGSVLTRRDLLLAGGSGAAVLAGAGLGLAELFAGPGSNAPGPAATPTPTPLPTDRKPTWVATVPRFASPGGFSIIGDSLVLASEGGMASLSAADGSQRWKWDTSAKPYSGPVIAGGQGIAPCGVVGSSIYCLGIADRTDQPIMFTIDPAGNVTSSTTLDMPLPSRLLTPLGMTVCAVTDTTLILTQRSQIDSGGIKAVVGYDLVTGANTWTHPLVYPIDNNVSTNEVSVFVVADARTCYIQDGQDTYAIDLTTNRLAWHTEGTADPGVPTNLVLADGALLVGSMHVCALDPATGRLIWTSAKDWPPQGAGPGYSQNFVTELVSNIYASLLTVAGQTAYFADGSNAVWAMDVHTGDMKWQYTNDLLQVDGSGRYQATTGFASEQLVAVPFTDGAANVYGFQVLDAATGRALASCLPPQDSSSRVAWQVLVSGGDVYAYAFETVCKYERLAA